MDIDIAIKKTLVHEGGYVNNPADRGGPTNYGITQADMPGVDMRTVTADQATAYYKEHYVKPLYAQINDQALGEKIFDMGVLFGVGTAVKLLQLSMESEISLISDGVFGPQTLADVNQYANVQQYRTVLINHVMNILNNNPSQSVFVNGWVARINS